MTGASEAPQEDLRAQDEHGVRRLPELGLRCDDMRRTEPHRGDRCPLTTMTAGLTTLSTRTTLTVAATSTVTETNTVTTTRHPTG